MSKNRTSFIQQIVYTKFDAAFYDPAKRPIVVIDDIVYQEWVVELKGQRRKVGEWK